LRVQLSEPASDWGRGDQLWMMSIDARRRNQGWRTGASDSGDDVILSRNSIHVGRACVMVYIASNDHVQTIQRLDESGRYHFPRC
jgi:hypothetical protein